MKKRHKLSREQKAVLRRLRRKHCNDEWMVMNQNKRERNKNLKMTK
jgi:hypothetical protein